VKHARDATKQYARTGVHLKRLQRSKFTAKKQQTDPLLDTMDVSKQHGRSKKKEKRKKPLPIHVSVETRIKQLRAAAAKRLGKDLGKVDQTYTK